MTPIANLGSIMQHGLLSHARADGVPHESVAMEEIQERRAARRVPNARPLHEYVNLYFDARNAMMWARRSTDLVVIRVAPDVLDLSGVVVTDGNAANNPTRFYASPAGLEHLEADRVFAESWTHSDPWQKLEWKRQRQAEVLVPDSVPPLFILGCYTRNGDAASRCRPHVGDLTVEVNGRVYFD